MEQECRKCSGRPHQSEKAGIELEGALFHISKPVVVLLLLFSYDELGFVNVERMVRFVTSRVVDETLFLMVVVTVILMGVVSSSMLLLSRQPLPYSSCLLNRNQWTRITSLSILILGCSWISLVDHVETSPQLLLVLRVKDDVDQSFIAVPPLNILNSFPTFVKLRS